MGRTITILTWNIDARIENRAERLAAVGETVRKLDPDILCFQEVLLATYGVLQRLLAAGCYVDSGFARSGSGLQTVLFARDKIAADFETVPLASRMGRTCVLARCRKLNLTVASCHMESFKHNVGRRSEQTLQIHRALLPENAVVLSGDMNFILPQEGFPSPWLDVGPSEYTYDSLSNTSIRDGFRSRLDRIYVKCVGNIDCRLVGTEPVDGVFPSDHFGIYAELTLTSQSEEPPPGG
ncbi:Endonuclease/exonuclease/phosphatase [Fimicolochytrium jonesii]|uniref:Endonuclease/exonuclease/phosphatase n=1 Tax=Fimicolochytrium jonesii TaxID=1396493 RepID=UPI0022FE1AA4|nr:Endonuclease/exonuclease/phosphatase [Fimicolochytrium jonesii]KAI8826290.1 Endonuclease/exonuclease/phosphatase [Fimicolochytrium jonesii]